MFCRKFFYNRNSNNVFESVWRYTSTIYIFYSSDRKYSTIYRLVLVSTKLTNASILSFTRNCLKLCEEVRNISRIYGLEVFDSRTPMYSNKQIFINIRSSHRHLTVIFDPQIQHDPQDRVIWLDLRNGLFGDAYWHLGGEQLGTSQVKFGLEN